MVVRPGLCFGLSKTNFEQTLSKTCLKGFKPVLNCPKLISAYLYYAYSCLLTSLSNNAIKETKHHNNIQIVLHCILRYIKLLQILCMLTD
jgi:hypothetical protein